MKPAAPHTYYLPPYKGWTPKSYTRQAPIPDPFGLRSALMRNLYGFGPTLRGPGSSLYPRYGSDVNRAIFNAFGLDRNWDNWGGGASWTGFAEPGSPPPTLGGKRVRGIENFYASDWAPLKNRV